VAAVVLNRRLAEPLRGLAGVSRAARHGDRLLHDARRQTQNAATAYEQVPSATPGHPLPRAVSHARPSRS